MVGAQGAGSREGSGHHSRGTPRPALPSLLSPITLISSSASSPDTHTQIKMKAVFEAADEDGSGELDPGEFWSELGPYLGAGLR